MAPFIALSLVGLYWSFVVSPADYQQGESVRIMYVHVPEWAMVIHRYMWAFDLNTNQSNSATWGGNLAYSG
jgi:ABC-type transport system involved in cytochrome c biogenesis permease subunit